MADPSDMGTRDRPGPLFSMDAAANAEVVQPDAPRGPESMWTTRSDASPTGSANGASRPPLQPPFAGTAAPADHVAGAGHARSHAQGERAGSDATDWEPRSADPWADLRDGGLGDAPDEPTAVHDSGTTTSPFAATVPGGVGVDGGVFSADPIVYDDDVVDSEIVVDPVEEDAVGDPGPPGGVGDARPPLFSSGRPDGTAAATAPDASEIWRVLDDDAAPTDRTGTVHAAADDPAPRPHAGPASTPGATPVDAVGQHGHHMGPGHGPLDEDDPNGFERAVAHLGEDERERAAVPLCVCGALLDDDEWVVGALTGQMLGRPAAVVVTGSRVLVANGRRWQPIVDEFPIDDRLSVRGRHDGRIAALSFADDERLSMVDGIEQVALAMQLAEAVREPSRAARQQ